MGIYKSNHTVLFTTVIPSNERETQGVTEREREREMKEDTQELRQEHQHQTKHSWLAK